MRPENHTSIFKLHRPANRKIMIRDLPVQVADYLDVAYRPILQKKATHSHRWPKKWANPTQPHRVAAKIVKKYRNLRVLPRMNPFQCPKCGLHSRSLSVVVRFHICEPNPYRPKKPRSREAQLQHELKLMLEPEKYWRIGSHSVMEQSREPARLMRAYKKVMAERAAAEAAKFDKRAQKEAMKKGGGVVVAPTSKKEAVQNDDDDDSDEFIDEGCGRRVVERPPKKGTMKEVVDPFDNDDDASDDDIVVMKPRKPTDVSQIECTKCQKKGFTSRSDLYEHMVKCGEVTFEEWVETQTPEYLERGPPPGSHLPPYIRKNPFHYDHCD